LNPPVPIDASQAGAAAPPNGLLDVQRCQVVGVNQNYASSSGTQYHIQVEDRGPVLDRVTETLVRRVNLIIYANYGEPNAHILYGHDYDWDDVRTAEYNRLIEERVKDLAAAARVIIEEKEERQVVRIKHFIRRYYRTRDEGAKREFELANALFPFLFSRAWAELKRERDARQSQASAAEQPGPLEALLAEEPVSETEVAAEEVQYPLDPNLREYVIEIERVLNDISAGLDELRNRGAADDILLQTCRKLKERAREILAGREPSEVTTRRLDSMRQTLLTTWKQIQSRLKAE
jgi:hypothetical protein